MKKQTTTRGNYLFTVDGYKQGTHYINEYTASEMLSDFGTAYTVKVKTETTPRKNDNSTKFEVISKNYSEDGTHYEWEYDKTANFEYSLKDAIAHLARVFADDERITNLLRNFYEFRKWREENPR